MHALPARRKFETSPIHAVGVALMTAALIAGLFFLVLDSDVSASFPYFSLLPWILLLLLVLGLPYLILLKQVKFNLADPLVYAGWSYFFPAFVFGGFALAAGLSQPSFLTYIQDPKTTLPWTIVIIILGYVGLSAGYFLPVGDWLGKRTSSLIPSSADKPAETLVVPGIALLVLGMINSALAITIGIFGYQERTSTVYDGLVSLSAMFWLEATFLLWFIVFRRPKFTRGSLTIVAFLVSTSILRALLSGSRGNFLQSAVIVVLAYVLAGRRLNIKQGAVVAVGFFIALLIGMIYGTSFRETSANNPNSGLEPAARNVIDSFDKINSNSGLDSIAFGFSTLAERLDMVSTLGVIVSNYEELAPYEEGYGLNDNIRKDVETMFIPRVIWSDKPIASDARSYGELYFNYGETSFAMTPIGDLLRNYGVVGVPIGMMFLGILLRVMYSALISSWPASALRTTMYFMLFASVNYEGFYSTILSGLIKMGVVAAIGLILVNIIAKGLNYTRRRNNAH